MSITGYLSEFSLPELFQFLEQGQKTGLLTINSLTTERTTTGKSFYIWFREGMILAGANQLNNQGLMGLIKQRKWHGEEVLQKVADSCPLGTPYGLCLKSQGLVDADQLKILFSVQVLRQVCDLFSLSEGFFSFETEASFPVTEMTGLSTPANEVTLSGLRALKNWTALADKLPAPSSGLSSLLDGKPKMSLNSYEWQIWEYTKGNTTIQEIAENLDLELKNVQQIAFRLIVVGLVEEIPMLGLINEDIPKEEKKLEEKLFVDSLVNESMRGQTKIKESLSQMEESEPKEESKQASNQGLSKSFFEGLMGFLRNKV
jgi:Domain of unknown function (DUF4388)